MSKILYLIRGVPGSGKSTLAKQITENVCEADDYFYLQYGTYHFDPSKLREAHDFCYNKCKSMMTEPVYYIMDTPGEEHVEIGHPVIAIANTFTRKWEMKRYVDLANEHGYTVIEIICRGKFKNVHGVPYEKVKQMRKRFEY